MDNATSTVAMVLAQTIVLAPNHGASRRAAAISAPRLAMPTQNTTISSSGARLVVTRETYRHSHGGRSRPYAAAALSRRAVAGSAGTSTSAAPGREDLG